MTKCFLQWNLLNRTLENEDTCVIWTLSKYPLTCKLTWRTLFFQCVLNTQVLLYVPIYILQLFWVITYSVLLFAIAYGSQYIIIEVYMLAIIFTSMHLTLLVLLYPFLKQVHAGNY